MRCWFVAIFLLACEHPKDTTAPKPVPVVNGCAADASDKQLVFLGEFVRAQDNPAQLGYARPLRTYVFRPLQGWRGHFTGEPIEAEVFVDVCNDPTIPCDPKTLPAPPAFRAGERVLVTIDFGGMSGQIPLLTRTIPEADAGVTSLGPPCWSMRTP